MHACVITATVGFSRMLARVRYEALLGVVVGACSFAAPVTPITEDAAPDVATDTVISSRVTDGLVGFWKFDELAGEFVVDQVAAPPETPPANLTISPATSVAWVPEGLSITGPVAISSDPNPHHGRQIETARQVTIEAWVTPENATQGSGVPIDGVGENFAVVVSAAGSIVSRDGMLAQVGDHWTGRVRTSTTDGNALPAIETPAGSATSGAVTHLVLVATDTSRTLFVDGMPYTVNTGVGVLDWDRSYPVRIAYELNYDRHWLGTIWMLAIYDRALSQAEVSKNFEATHQCRDC